MSLTVSKFGGTSMGSAEAINQVADIIGANSGPESHDQQNVVVVSAVSGTTNNLIAAANAAESKGDWRNSFEIIFDTHRRIIEELGIEMSVDEYEESLSDLLTGVEYTMEISKSIMDRILGYGERMSHQMLAKVFEKRGMKSEAVDAMDLIKTDNNYGDGNVDYSGTKKATREKLIGLLDSGVVPVVTGFLGESAEGKSITLGRGGSDRSASILGEALEADAIDIWTDVSGISNVDPRLIENAEFLKCMSFAEAAELAYFGAKVLHPRTIEPAGRGNIPVRILNTFCPEAEGTLISSDVEDSIKSVTYRKNASIVNIESNKMLGATGFMEKIFKVFRNAGVVVDVVSTSEVSVSVTVDNGAYNLVQNALEEFAIVEVELAKSIVCLVGEGIRSDQGVLGKLFGTLVDHNISMVSQGASKRNITFVVEENEVEEVVEKVYETFFEANI